MKNVDVETTKQPKFWLALLSVIGITIVGSVIWGFLYYAGFLAWIVSYLMFVFSAWVYTKLNLKMDVKGYIIITVLTIVGITLAILITLQIVAYVAALDAGMSITFMEAFRLMFDLLQSVEGGVASLIIDIVLSLIMVVAGVLTYFVYEKQLSKRKAQSEGTIVENNLSNTIIIENSDKTTEPTETNTTSDGSKPSEDNPNTENTENENK
mgnify:FL=1